MSSKSILYLSSGNNLVYAIKADRKPSLGTLVTASAHNQEAKEVLDAVYTNLGRNEVKESFKEWASSIDKIRVESKGTLGISDFASIASLLGAPATEDSSWISSTYVHISLILGAALAGLLLVKHPAHEIMHTDHLFTGLSLESDTKSIPSSCRV